MLDVLESEAALDAEVAVRDRIVGGRVDPHDPVVLHVQDQPASDTAEAADRLGGALSLGVPCPRRPKVELGGRHQRPRRAHLDAVAAVHARRVGEWHVVLGGDVSGESAAGDRDDEALLPLLPTRVDALVAEDALGVVAHVEVVVDLHRLGDGRRSVAVAADVDAVLVVPFRHVLREREVDGRTEELQHHPSGVVDPFGTCADGHPGLQRSRARGHQRPRTLDVDHAQSTRVLRRDRVAEAQRRDVAAGAAACLEDRRARTDLDRRTVDRRRDAIGSVTGGARAHGRNTPRSTTADSMAW